MHRIFKLARRMARWRFSARPARLSPASSVALLALLALGVGCQSDKLTDAAPGANAEEADAAMNAEEVRSEPAPTLAAAATSSVAAALPSSTGTTFYVSPSGSDANPGTLSAPWKTIQKAMTTLRAGQQAYVRAGTYTTGGTFGTDADTYTWSTDCTLSSPCSIVAYPGEKPVLHGQVRISGGNYLRLSGFIIEGPLSANVKSCSGRRATQVKILSSSYVEISNNEIRYNDYHAGLYVDGSNHMQVLNNWIHDNGRFMLTYDPCTGNEVAETDHGIYWHGTNGAGNVVANNLLQHNRAKGAQWYPSAFDVVVTENTAVDNGGTGFKVAGSSDRITLANNVAAFNGTYSIRVESGNANRVEGNLTYPGPVSNTTGSVVRDNILADPLFVDRSAGNYRVRSGSPAIDRALGQWATATALDGMARPQGTAPDLGAYER